MLAPPPGFEHVILKNTCNDKTMPHTCRNCGLTGHLYKDCPHPIMSFGVICFRFMDGNDIEYLMIQRKDSLSFMEFIRGKYKHDQIEYICKLLAGMAQSERQLLRTKSFEELWNIVWYQQTLPKQSSEYNDAKKKFDLLRKGFSINGTHITLDYLLDTSPSPYVEPEWGFPKGRRHLREEDVSCAVREFCEETAFEPSDIELVKDLPPFEEIFFGTNKVLYRHVYYVASLTKDRVTFVDPDNINQAREVRAISWFKYEDTLNNIRSHNQERKELFQQAHQKIVSFIRSSKQ